MFMLFFGRFPESWRVSAPWVPTMLLRARGTEAAMQKGAGSSWWLVCGFAAYGYFLEGKIEPGLDPATLCRGGKYDKLKAVDTEKGIFGRSRIGCENPSEAGSEEEVDGISDALPKD